MARLKGDSSKKAYEYIQNKINNYDLIPGDTVSDLGISEELEMSRTPIREAIMDLARYKLVEKQKTKFVVTNITVQDIREIIEVREAVEVMSAKLIIDNGGLTKIQKKELDSIENNLSKCLEAKDYYNNFKYDSLFHSSIVKFSKNSRLIFVMESLAIQGERLRWLSLLTPNRYKTILNEHSKIMLAIKSKNLLDSYKCIHEHLQKSEISYKQITSIDNWENVIISFKQAFNK